MTGRHVLILICALIAFAGVRHVSAQQPDPFERANCEQDFVKLREAVDKRGMALQNAGKQKADPAQVCRLLRDYTSHEAQLVKFMQEKQTSCGIPEQVVGQVKTGHSKAIEMRNKVCQVAAAPRAPPPPPPSQGLSGALGGSSVGGAPPETAGGSGVFDSLTGNVLKR